MSIATIIKDKFPTIYSWVRDGKLMVRHQSLSPSKVTLPSGQTIFVDWKEPRGHAILRGQGKGQPYIKALWKKIMKHLQPDIILDCGANYGELAFYTQYAEHQKVYAIEADASLMPWLKKSHQAHPNQAQIEVINALLGAKSGTSQTFYVDKKWSGRSTALENHGFKDFYTIEIPTISIDDMVSEVDLGNKGIFFKIDVEGYEPFVLEGMQKLINTSKWQVGIIEFNLNFFEKRGIATTEYIDTLNQHFQIALIGSNQITPLERLDLKELKANRFPLTISWFTARHFIVK